MCACNCVTRSLFICVCRTYVVSLLLLLLLLLLIFRGFFLQSRVPPDIRTDPTTSFLEVRRAEGGRARHARLDGACSASGSDTIACVGTSGSSINGPIIRVHRARERGPICVQGEKLAFSVNRAHDVDNCRQSSAERHRRLLVILFESLSASHGSHQVCVLADIHHFIGSTGRCARSISADVAGWKQQHESARTPCRRGELASIHNGLRYGANGKADSPRDVHHGGGRLLLPR